MGYVKHYAMVVTTYDLKKSTEAWNKATEIFGFDMITPIQQSQTNMYYTFFISPSGSKMGWETAEEHERDRDEFITWMEKRMKETEDSSDDFSSWDYAEFQYGGDDDLTEILRKKPNYSSRGCRRGKGWHGDRFAHGLARRGMRTR